MNVILKSVLLIFRWNTPRRTRIRLIQIHLWFLAMLAVILYLCLLVIFSYIHLAKWALETFR